jgi:small subunit ribosomal protein S20
MAKTKSAEKRTRQNEKRYAANRIWRAGSRTAVKKARTALDTNENSVEAVRAAVVALDRAASKGVIHKNNASRRKGRLMQALAKATA